MGEASEEGGSEGRKTKNNIARCVQMHIACVASTPILTFIDSTIRTKKKKSAPGDEGLKPIQ